MTEILETRSLTKTYDPQPTPVKALRGVDLTVERGEFVAIVGKAQRKDASERYQTMSDLSADLRHFKRKTDSGLVPPVSPPRSSQGPLLAGGAAALVLIVFALAWGLGRSGADGTDLANAPVGVLGFENLNDPADARHLGRMLMGLVTTDLSESGGLQVISTSRILSAIREIADGSPGFDTALAGQAAKQAGVRMMLVGQIAERGEGMLLTAELVDVREGRTLGSWTRETKSEDELFELAGTLGNGVRETLGIGSTKTGGAPIDLASTLTDSPEAYRQFATGEVALHELRFEEATRRFAQALEQDPTFALASFRLGMAYDWLAQHNRSNAALRAGLQHIGRLPGRWQGIYRATVAAGKEDYDTAYQELIVLEDMASDLADFFNSLGEVYTHGSRYIDPIRSRVCFERALEADPTFKVVLFHLMETYFLADDDEAARSLAERYREIDPDDPAAVAAEVALLLAEGRTDESLALADRERVGNASMFALAIMALLRSGQPELAERVAEEAVGRYQGYLRSEALADRSFARVARGHLRAALADLKEEAPEFNETSETYRMPALVLRSMVSWVIGKPEEWVGEVRAACEDDPWSSYGAFWLGFYLCEAGRIDEAEEVLAQLVEREPEIVSPLVGFWRPLLTCAVHMARDDLGAARRELEAAYSTPVEYRDRGMAALIRARLEAASGNRAEAIAAYREVLDPPYLRYSSAATRNFPWRPMEIPVLYDLALLEEAEGDDDDAREHYRTFLEYWGEADLPMPSIANARERLERLRD